MELAARVIAATAWDLAQDPNALAQAREEFSRRTGHHHYEAMLEPGQAPPLDYRNSPSAN